MTPSQYISQTQFTEVITDLDMTSTADSYQQEINDRATADIEADLSQKFLVPLYVNTAGDYATASPQFSVNKMVNLFKSKMREIIGYDQNRNLTGVIESTQKFINIHGIEYQKQLKDVLNPKITYGWALQPQAIDSQSPVQHLSLSRANDRTEPFGHDDGGLLI